MNETPERQHFEKICQQLGEDKAIAFFEFALPRLRQRYDDLLVFLQEGEFDQVVRQAHLIKGTVNVFGSNELIALLDDIISAPASMSGERLLLLQNTIKNNLQQIELLIK